MVKVTVPLGGNELTWVPPGGCAATVAETVKAVSVSSVLAEKLTLIRLVVAGLTVTLTGVAVLLPKLLSPL
jgi:hypothetical protein